MSTQKKWKLAQMLCLAVMLAGIIGLGVSVFGEAGPAAPWGIAALAGLWGNLVRPGPAPPEGEVSGLAKPTARTCGSVPSKRGVQPPLRGAKRQRRHSAVGQPGVRPGPAPPEGEVSGHSKTNGADVRQRPQQARRSAAAPWREETAEALRCGAAWRASWPSHLTSEGNSQQPGKPWGPGRPSGDCRATGSSNQKVLPWPRVLVTP